MEKPKKSGRFFDEKGWGGREDKIESSLAFHIILMGVIQDLRRKNGRGLRGGKYVPFCVRFYFQDGRFILFHWPDVVLSIVPPLDSSDGNVEPEVELRRGLC